MEGFAPLLRRAYAPVLARLLRHTRDLHAAEDAVQEAVARALATWPERGVPDAPEAWLVRVATNIHRDGLRRRCGEQRHATALAALAARCPWSEALLSAPDAARWPDDVLRLVVTCCDPALGLEERAALALSTVAALSTDEIAHAFLVSAQAMERRLTRARERLRERRKHYEVPRLEEAPERLHAVLAVIHLVFNAGYWSRGDEAPIRRGLTRLSMHLARALDAALPRVPEVQGLLSLLLLHAARMPARTDEEGQPRSLEQQDRSRWDSAAIDEACALLREALERGRPGPYQIEAAIAAVHCSAPRAEDTDWLQIAILYESLEQHRPGPIVRVNRAFAVARALGAAEGLKLIATAIDHPALARYPYAHLVQGVLLEETGRVDQALAALERARDCAANAAERAQIEQRIDALRPRALCAAAPAPDATIAAVAARGDRAARIPEPE
ncbi:sigma-70 family RNA polymerase sigma factor [Sorangium sp. So ce1504]|uniref:RNA polymerase sigma factor n=1 Tax=Sorangium sp. So ce1504 TaxID=3133337 RepID=UPI003F60370E